MRVYENVLTNANYWRDKAKETKTERDSELCETVAHELYQVAMDLEKTAEVNPPAGGLIAKIRELQKTIEEYESDTFSASASKLTKEEAERMTETLIVRTIQRLIDTETMDGLMLQSELDEIRPEEE